MHLGRFHAVVNGLANHFKEADLPAKIEAAAAAIDAYATNRTPAQIEAFRKAFTTLNRAAEVENLDLYQPYAQEVIADLALTEILGTRLSERLSREVSASGFDHAGLAATLREIAAEVTKKIKQLAAINNAFTALGVEYEQVTDSEAEVGFLLPKAAVGEHLRDLTSEFAKLGRLAAAINELTGAEDYEPKVRTISSSAWQVFLELGVTQVLIWVAVIERIVQLFKSNLEIKVLQKQLSEQNMPKPILEAIEKEVNNRVTVAIDKMASDLRKEHAADGIDKGRLHEIENQLRPGLRYLANRIHQGAQVEINVAVPDEPEDPPAPAEGETVDESLLTQITSQRAHIASLRQLRDRAQSASVETLVLSEAADMELLPYLKEEDADTKPERPGKHSG